MIIDNNVSFVIVKYCILRQTLWFIRDIYGSKIVREWFRFVFITISETGLEVGAIYFLLGLELKVIFLIRTFLYWTGALSCRP